MNQHRFLLLHDISPSRPQSYTLNSKGGSVSLTLAQRENELEEDIQNKCIKSRSTEDWSKEAGMHETYLTAYTILSNTVHSKVRDLQDYFGIDENGEIKTFHWGPSDKGVLRVLATSIEGMLLSLAVTSSFFDKEQNEIIEGYQKKLGKMMSEANIT